MKIGFLGNANNYPFMLARAIKSLGHEVVFVVDSESRLNRPEGRYKEITLPYPSWIVDCSPLDLWQYPPNFSQTEKVVRILQECDVLVLNEFGLTLWGRIQKPAFALLTGTDLEVLADPQYADFSVGDMGEFMSPLKKLWRWKRGRTQRRLRAHLLHLIGEQRNAIRHAVGVNYFPQGMLPNADRLLAGLGVDEDRRVFFFVVDIERFDYATYPDNRTLRLFNVARITWRKPRDYFICELDYKGTDVLIRGLGMFVRESGIPIEIRLVKKGADLELARQLIEGEGLAPNVTWLEEMDQSKLYDEYKNADIVSEHFGQGSIGMGAWDAMAVGRPVIANGSPEIFRKALGAAPPICHATTAEEVRDQLLRLAADRDLRVSIGKQSRLYVEKYWTRERAASIIIEKLNHAK
jgi:glycosyltransferase involved in cell wall biosynthesis